MSASIHKIKPSSAQPHEPYRLLLGHISRCLNEHLSEHISRLFDSADDTLFQLAENAESNEQQNAYFETMRNLRLERNKITEEFAQRIKHHLSHKPTTKRVAFDEDELSLVDQSEMEEMVAISAMHSRAMSLYGEQVNHLEARIEFALLKSPGLIAKDALLPKTLCQAFSEALADIQLSAQNRLILYKLFEQTVIGELEAMYRQLNQLFIDEGILPQIKAKHSLNRDTHRPSPPPQAQAPAAGASLEEQMVSDVANAQALYSQNLLCNPLQGRVYTGAPSGLHIQNDTQNFSQQSSVQQQIHHVINQFIQGERRASGPGIPTSFTQQGTPSERGLGDTQYYDRRDVMQALSSLQDSSLQAADVALFDLTQFKRALVADMGSRSAGAVTRQINQVDEKTIDFIEMLFASIVDDESISETITHLILRLQIALIKASLLDDTFFSDLNHPCKSFLNLLAYLGKGISNSDDDLYLELEQVVENLLADFTDDISAFVTANDQLIEIQHKELELTAEKERQTQQAVLRTHAREMVLTELQHHASGKRLPKQAQKLILKLWSTLMFHHYIQFGKNSQAWQEASQQVRELISLVQPIESPQALFQVQSSKTELLEKAHLHLVETQLNPEEVDQEIDQVDSFVEQQIANSGFQTSNTADSQTYFTAVDANEQALSQISSDDEPDICLDQVDDTDPLEELSRVSQQKVDRLPEEVKPGVWFEVFNGEERPVRRAKLSVIILEEAKLVFVDRLGVKVMVKEADEFSNELESEQSRIIADHSAFDHALGRVINSLSGSR